MLTSHRERVLAHLLAQRVTVDHAATSIVLSSGLKLRPDVVLPSLRTVVEYDGRAWHGFAQAIERDTGKTAALIADGWRVFRLREVPLPLLPVGFMVSCLAKEAIELCAGRVLDALDVPGPHIFTVADVALAIKGADAEKSPVRDNLAGFQPDIAAEWHHSRNAGLTPELVTIGSKRRVWWLCAVCGHEWQSCPKDRVSGYGCPGCSGHAVSDRNRLSLRRPDIAAEWHPTRNGELTPDQVSYGSGRRVWWLGFCGHSWQAAISTRTCMKAGCGVCWKYQRAAVSPETRAKIGVGVNKRFEDRAIHARMSAAQKARQARVRLQRAG